MPTFAADGTTIALVLLAALLHASWNAVTRASGDPLVNIAVVTSVGGLAALPFLFVFPLPGPETARWLAFSALVHFAYQLGLARMYRLGELSQVYPIARGLAPLGVAALGAAFAGERLAAHQTAGLVVAAGAIVTFGRAGTRGAATRQAVATAVGVAVLIGLYTYSDGRGVRTVAAPEHYIAWSFFLGCVPFALFTARVRGRAALGALRRDGPHAIAGGVMATLGYGIALWAMARAPMALVAALRESSVLFAALIGVFFLGERFGRARIAAAAMLAAGLVAVQLAPG